MTPDSPTPPTAVVFYAPRLDSNHCQDASAWGAAYRWSYRSRPPSDHRRPPPHPQRRHPHRLSRHPFPLTGSGSRTRGRWSRGSKRWSDTANRRSTTTSRSRGRGPMGRRRPLPDGVRHNPSDSEKPLRNRSRPRSPLRQSSHIFCVRSDGRAHPGYIGPLSPWHPQKCPCYPPAYPYPGRDLSRAACHPNHLPHAAYHRCGPPRGLPSGHRHPSGRHPSGRHLRPANQT